MLKYFPASWRKALRDLWLNKARAFLVVLSISIGVFGFGLVANSYAILVREMDANYLRTNPAAATLYTTALDKNFLQTVRDLPQVDDVEARRMVVGRVQVGENEWKNIWLFVVDDFDSVRLDKFFPEAGQYPAKTGDILLERAALKVANAEIGQTLRVEIPDSPITSLHLVGSVHAPGEAPAWMEGLAYGFISRETFAQLGSDSTLNELKVTFKDKTLTQTEARAAAFNLKSWMESNGHPVTRIEVPKPGKHPHATQMATLLFLLEAFGLIALFLSAVLVVNMISALLAQQIRQIGVMKAIGTSRRQVTSIYYGMVIFLGLAGLLIGLPLAILAGRGYAAFAAQMLNFQIFDDSIGWPYLALQILVGLLVPLLAASYPILRGSRISVREAMSDYGISQQTGNIRLPKFASRPFMLSLRNTFRQRGRLFLTLGTLAIGGAGFIVAMNVSASMKATVDDKFNAQKYDVQFTFNRSYSEQELEQTAKSLDGVARVESWGSASTVRLLEDGTESNDFSLIAPPENTNLITSLPLMEGRWLQPDDDKALVFNNVLLALHPDLRVGDTVTLNIAGKESEWRLVGVAQEIMSPPFAYVNKEALNRALGLDGMASALVVVSQNRNAESVASLTRSLEAKFAATGLDVARTIRMVDARKMVEDHLQLLASFLMIMSILVLLVGGLGLASTMSINVMERTREIGVMRAIGASTRSILKIIVSEGAIIGALAWILALVISRPISQFVSTTFGMTFFEAPLRFAVSQPGILGWLAISIGFSALASLYPAWSATQLTVRQILAYE
jgi:putative ABC transport system permease protein